MHRLLNIKINLFSNKLKPIFPITGRSNSLRVVDDILLRRSNSLRQGLTNVGNPRRKSSLEDIGLSHFSSNHANPIKIALNGSIGLEVTPPEEVGAPVMSSNTSLYINPPSLSGAASALGKSYVS